MIALNYCLYIFNLDTIISSLSELKIFKESLNNHNQTIINGMDFQNIYNNIELISGIQEFFSLLIEENKKIYIVTDISEELLNIITLINHCPNTMMTSIIRYAQLFSTAAGPILNKEAKSLHR